VPKYKTGNFGQFATGQSFAFCGAARYPSGTIGIPTIERKTMLFITLSKKAKKYPLNE
jgi:hypothetical protein